ncbi:polysaccharide deacetylase family protein [Marinobacter salarius]|uniref:polysaccharide deacetylase family protein n=1 Tax=Marinobacter salarius TaxID=1420917 RepID=UPI003D123840
MKNQILPNTNGGIITIRFDIDTITCLERGVPELLDIAKKEGIQFTFFVNMGRAVSYAPVVKRYLSRRNHSGIQEEKAAHFSPLQKLGIRDWMRTVILNPRVGKSRPDLLKRIVAEGHDLGLHGGRNHGLWHHDSRSWTLSEILAELDWGLNAMISCGLPRPKMFASPGFTHPKALNAALEQKGFTVVADEHLIGAALFSPTQETTGLPLRANTGIVAEPGGVGFFENWYAKQKTRSEMLSLLQKLKSESANYMCYDHPAFSASEGRSLLLQFIHLWKSAGGRFAKLSSIEPGT